MVINGRLVVSEWLLDDCFPLVVPYTELRTDEAGGQHWKCLKASRECFL